VKILEHESDLENEKDSNQIIKIILMLMPLMLMFLIPFFCKFTPIPKDYWGIAIISGVLIYLVIYVIYTLILHKEPKNKESKQYDHSN